jgi:hypothetical protein
MMLPLREGAHDSARAIPELGPLQLARRIDLLDLDTSVRPISMSTMDEPPATSHDAQLEGRC